jgi:hypothetical protein
MIQRVDCVAVYAITDANNHEKANGPYHAEQSAFPRFMTNDTLFLGRMSILQRRLLSRCMTGQTGLIRFKIGMQAVERDNGRLLSGGRREEEQDKNCCTGDDERPGLFEAPRRLRHGASILNVVNHLF